MYVVQFDSFVKNMELICCQHLAFPMGITYREEEELLCLLSCWLWSFATLLFYWHMNKNRHTHIVYMWQQMLAAVNSSGYIIFIIILYYIISKTLKYHLHIDRTIIIIYYYYSYHYKTILIVAIFQHCENQIAIFTDWIWYPTVPHSSHWYKGKLQQKPHMQTPKAPSFLDTVTETGIDFVLILTHLGASVWLRPVTWAVSMNFAQQRKRFALWLRPKKTESCSLYMDHWVVQIMILKI